LVAKVQYRKAAGRMPKFWTISTSWEFSCYSPYQNLRHCRGRKRPTLTDNLEPHDPRGPKGGGNILNCAPTCCVVQQSPSV